MGLLLRGLIVPVGLIVAPAASVSRVVGGAVALPLRLADGLERTLGHIEEMAFGVEAMRGEFVAMRGEIRELGGEVRGLRGDVQSLGGGVDAMRADVAMIRPAIENLDQRLGALALNLESVNALAARFGRVGRRRALERGAAAEAEAPTSD